MEDPAAEARREISIDPADRWAGDGPPRRRRPRDGLWVALFIVLAAAAIALTLQRQDRAAADDPRAALARGDVVGLAERSLARPANLAPVIARAREVAGPRDRVASLRVAPAGVRIAMVTPAGRRYVLTAGLSGEMTRRDVADVPRLPRGRLADVDPAVIRRAVAASARAGAIPLERFDYAVLTDPGPGQRIGVFFDADGVRDDAWIGQGDGARMRRADPSAPGPGTAAARPSGDGAVEEQMRILRCVQDAGSDPGAIARCVS